MKEFAMKLLPLIVAGLITAILYDKFVKGFVGNYERDNNFEVDENGTILKVA